MQELDKSKLLQNESDEWRWKGDQHIIHPIGI